MKPEDCLTRRILSVDYGKRFTGIAVCDELHIVVRPVTTLKTSETDFFDNFRKIIDIEKPALIVIGAPLRNDEKNQKLIDEIYIFAEKVKENLMLPVEIVDEAFSSKLAVRAMIDSGRKKHFRRNKDNLNKFAAAVILEEFLKIYG
ncbi:MAG: Holliday junction resolvase RuvX [Candidatus Kapabacteria bacterium]|nr:Holliday junction resolvase RuvX [Candidatus Kapabacteria bacterium]